MNRMRLFSPPSRIRPLMRSTIFHTQVIRPYSKKNIDQLRGEREKFAETIADELEKYTENLASNIKDKIKKFESACRGESTMTGEELTDLWNEPAFLVLKEKIKNRVDQYRDAYKEKNEFDHAIMTLLEKDLYSNTDDDADTESKSIKVDDEESLLQAEYERQLDESAPLEDNKTLLDQILSGQVELNDENLLKLSKNDRDKLRQVLLNDQNNQEQEDQYYSTEYDDTRPSSYNGNEVDNVNRKLTEIIQGSNGQDVVVQEDRVRENYLTADSKNQQNIDLSGKTPTHK
ncbi:laminin subunit beta [Acrasis kona]|uniref:Laminin subunit beta n=1 Tax=Acrasis kona TaxID=1008807 RepID=A0AAW2Z2K5_9EUKA